MRWVFSAAFLLLALPAVPVHAKCMSPRPVLSPAPGSELPLNPVLWLFAPSFTRDPDLRAADAHGRKLPIEVTEMKDASSPALRVYQIRLRTEAKGKVVLDYVQPWADKRARAEYRIVSSGASPASGVEIVGKSETQLSWTCSHQSTVDLRISTLAPVYRVEWASTTEGYRSGHRRAVILPRDLRRFFGSTSPEDGKLSLGYVNCMGATLEWTEPAIFVGVSALFSDGTATPLPSAPTRIERPAPANSREE